MIESYVKKIFVCLRSRAFFLNPDISQYCTVHTAQVPCLSSGLFTVRGLGFESKTLVKSSLDRSTTPSHMNSTVKHSCLNFFGITMFHTLLLFNSWNSKKLMYSLILVLFCIYAHCPKNNLNIRIKAMQSVPVGADATVFVWFWANTKARPLHLHSSRDRRLDFYAEIQILFGTVLPVDKDGTLNLILLQDLPPPHS